MTPAEARRAHDLADVCDRLWAADYFGLTPAFRSKQAREPALPKKRAGGDQ